MTKKKTNKKPLIGRKGHKVLKEFKNKTLYSSSGQKVTSLKQARRIAISEQKRARKKH